MKKQILLGLMILFAIISCSKSEIETRSSIVGEWAYDNRDENVWEIVKFLPNGVFYFSNCQPGMHIKNENQDGRYSIDGDHITGSYNLNGALMNLDATVIKVTAYELTIKLNDSGLYFTYYKVLDEITVDCAKKHIPDYSKLVNCPISGFAAHDTFMASVDSKSGEITGELNGFTMIDVITEEGKAIILVNVTGLKDYTQDFGKTKAEIDNEYRTEYRTKYDDIFYINSNLIKYIGFSYDSKGEVYVVMVVIKDDANMTDMEIKEYLGKQYYIYEKGCEENYWAYMDSPERGTATAGIVWNTRVEENEGLKYIIYLNLN